MTQANNLASLSLDELAELYRVRAEACTQTSYPLEGYEPVFEAHTEIALELDRRGDGAVERILPLVDHPEEWVRYFAARDCYTIAPERCHRVLVDLAENKVLTVAWAIQTLLYFDPTFPEQLRAMNRRARARAAADRSDP